MKINHNYLRYILFTIILIIFGCEDKIQKWDLLINVSPIEAGIVVVLDNDTVSDTLSSSQKFDDGTEINIAAVVTETGWEFDHWEGDLSGSENPTTIVMDGDKSVTAVFTILQYPLSITISGEGEVTEEIVVAKTEDYDHGSTIQLTATPDTGWEFDHWEGDLSGSENPTTIVMDGDKSVTAVFTQIPYNINLTIIGNGTVTKNPDQETYFYNSIVQLTATADAGWVFEKWQGDLNGNTNPFNITIQSNINLEAVFVQVHTLSVAKIGEGSIVRKVGTLISTNLGDTIYKHSTQVQLTAEGDLGWEFDHWEGDLSGLENPTTITMDSNKSVTAVFVQIPYTINLTIVGNGTIAKNPDQGTYYYDTTVQLTAVPDTDWEFDHWEGNLSGSENPTTITMDNNKSVTVVFKLYAQIGTQYIGYDGLTVTLNSLNITEKTGSYEYTINYLLENKTTDQQIIEGSFKMFYANEPGGLPQYGSFNYMFPGDTKTRSHTFETLKNQPFGILEYFDNFFYSSPTDGSLQWVVPLP